MYQQLAQCFYAVVLSACVACNAHAAMEYVVAADLTGDLLARDVSVSGSEMPNRVHPFERGFRFWSDASGGGAAVNEMRSDEARRLQAVDSLMKRYDGSVPGASLLILRDGAPVVQKSYGLANLESQVAASPATNYRLASVTKQFTAASVLLLSQDGKLNLEDPVKRWLPSLPVAADPITLRHLLSHTSGLIDYEDVIPPELTAQLRDADVLKLLESQNRTYFTPGTSYRYSNSGYALLALIVAKASGTEFATFLRERIFTPLDMKATVAHEEGISNVANRAYGYNEREGKWERTDQSQTSAVLGDGGIYSSIVDLAKWDAALYDDRLLNASSRKLLFTPVTATDDPTIRYAMGWRITEEQIGGTTQWHSGETIGFRNVLIRYPQQRFTIILLTNRDDPEPYQTARQIAEIYLRN